jgi:hypothetical protein
MERPHNIEHVNLSRCGRSSIGATIPMWKARRQSPTTGAFMTELATNSGFRAVTVASRVASHKPSWSRWCAPLAPAGAGPCENASYAHQPF